MKTTVVPFDLRAWRRRLRWTQARAAEALGVSASAYCAAEYRAEDRAGAPVRKTLALLAQALEREQRHRGALTDIVIQRRCAAAGKAAEAAGPAERGEAAHKLAQFCVDYRDLPMHEFQAKYPDYGVGGVWSFQDYVVALARDVLK